MEHLTFYTEFVERNVLALTRPGLTKFECYATLMWVQEPVIMPMPLTLLKTITLHSFSRKDLVFWTCVVGVMAKYIGIEIKAMLRACFGTHFFELLVEISSWVVDALRTLDADLCKIETNRDPPKIFIPIPKTESNGCARSDSIICSLKNKRAVFSCV